MNEIYFTEDDVVKIMQGDHEKYVLIICETVTQTSDKFTLRLDVIKDIDSKLFFVMQYYCKFEPDKSIHENGYVYQIDDPYLTPAYLIEATCTAFEVKGNDKLIVGVHNVNKIKKNTI